MGDNVLVNRERTAVVDASEPGKKFQMRRKDAIRLGLIEDGEPKPQARRTAKEDVERTFTTSGPVEDAPKATKRTAKK